jgi:uncharacterized membrane protein
MENAPYVSIGTLNHSLDREVSARIKDRIMEHAQNDINRRHRNLRKSITGGAIFSLCIVAGGLAYKLQCSDDDLTQSALNFNACSQIVRPQITSTSGSDWGQARKPSNGPCFYLKSAPVHSALRL